MLAVDAHLVKEEVVLFCNILLNHYPSGQYRKLNRWLIEISKSLSSRNIHSFVISRLFHTLVA